MIDYICFHDSNLILVWFCIDNLIREGYILILDGRDCCRSILNVVVSTLYAVILNIYYCHHSLLRLFAYHLLDLGLL